MPRTVIVGAGIIGVSTAYYLSHSPSNTDRIITIVDPCPPASGASGKSAGFLSCGWTSKETSSLEELSFRLYRDLAERYKGVETWGYRECRVISVVSGKPRSRSEEIQWSETGPKRIRNKECSEKLSWLKPGAIESQTLLGDPGLFAQW